MNKKTAAQVICETLYTPGYSLRGNRVVIPKELTNRINAWSREDRLYITLLGNGIAIRSTKSGYDVGSMSAVSRRVPVSVLKKAGLYGKELVATVEEDELIVIRPCWDKRIQDLEDCLARIPNGLLTEIAHIIQGENAETEVEEASRFVEHSTTTPSGEVIKTNKSVIRFVNQHPLILLDYKEKVVFRPLDKVYFKFNGYWLKTNELVLPNNYLNIDSKLETFCLFPGVKRERGSFYPGWLLVSQIVAENVVRKLHPGKIARDVIFCYKPWIREEMEVFVNPPDDLEFNYIFGDIDTYISRCFRQIEESDIPLITHAPISITSSHLEIIKEDNKGSYEAK